jgi:hypothetical protein
MSEPECVRCGLTAKSDESDLRAALARAWGVAAGLRLKLEGSDRGERRPGGSETYGVNGQRIGRPRKASA